MANSTFLIFGGITMVTMGFAYLCMPEWVRKHVYRSALPESWTRWLYSKFVSEDTLVQITRFTIGPTLVVAGCLLLTTGIRGT
jgi:hypothetical protein